MITLRKLKNFYWKIYINHFERCKYVLSEWELFSVFFPFIWMDVPQLSEKRIEWCEFQIISTRIDKLQSIDFLNCANVHVRNRYTFLSSLVRLVTLAGFNCCRAVERTINVFFKWISRYFLLDSFHPGVGQAKEYKSWYVLIIILACNCIMERFLKMNTFVLNPKNTVSFPCSHWIILYLSFLCLWIRPRHIFFHFNLEFYENILLFRSIFSHFISFFRSSPLAHFPWNFKHVLFSNLNSLVCVNLNTL